MDVFIQKDAKTLVVEFTGTAGALLEELHINPEFVIIVMDGTLITTDDDVSLAKRIDLLSVVSGG
jgi:sulfur carrier protein ThiS